MVAMLGARQEAILTVLDEEGNKVQEFRALFTTRALADAEAKIGKSMSQVLGGFATGRSGVREISLLLQAGMEAHRRSAGTGKDPVSYDEACDVIDLVGLTPTAEAINKAIVAVFNYRTPPEPEPSSLDDGTAPAQPDAARLEASADPNA